jgi:hypothetical protein
MTYLEVRREFESLIGKLLGYEVPAISEPRLVNNSKMNLREIRCEGLDWI